MTELPDGFASLGQGFLLCRRCWCPVLSSRTTEHRSTHPAPAGPPIVLDLKRRRCRAGGIPIELAYNEIELLALLGARSGRVVTYQEITETLWGANTTAARQSLAVAIHQVRKAIGYPHQYKIQTARGLGYMVEEDVIGVVNDPAQ